jgi:hypothetical protein
MTRETRRVPEQYVEWPEKPKILFVAASPPGVGAIPVEAHLLALRKLIDPWVGHWETDEERNRQIDEHLIFLPDATADAIESAVAEGGFTHVHILAHGVQYMDGYDVRYGLALHNPRNLQGPADVVTGDRLATVLRAAEPSSEGLSRPIVVTMASCNSGNGGTVAGMGASIAHALHEAGIPMVVAGQFPISFAGSVLMVEVLYEGLLWGEDPRLSLNDLRRRLFSQNPVTHDWASLTAYASLPPEFERWLVDNQINQAMRGINIAMEVADTVTGRWLAPSQTSQTSASVKSMRETGDPEYHTQLVLFERIRLKIDAALERLKALQTDHHRGARISGLLASTEKRRAEAYLVYGEIYEEGEDAAKPDYAREFFQSLLKARRYYWEAFKADPANGWAVVQYLSLDLVVERINWTKLQKKGISSAAAPVPSQDEHDRADALWTLAHVISLNDLRSRDPQRTVWAHGNLIELYALGLLIGPIAEQYKPAELDNRAVRYAEDFVNLVGERAFEVYSTRRQMLRYSSWFSRIADLTPMFPPPPTPSVVDRIVAKLPQTEQPDWTY